MRNEKLKPSSGNSSELRFNQSSLHNKNISKTNVKTTFLICTEILKVLICKKPFVCLNK